MTSRRSVLGGIFALGLLVGAVSFALVFPLQFERGVREIRCRIADCAFDSVVVQSPTLIDLAWVVSAGVADTRSLPSELTFKTPSETPYLPSGWNPPRQRMGLDGKTDWVRNTRGPAASIEVPLVEPGPLTVVVDAAAVSALLLPRQYLDLLWNDEFVARHELPPNGKQISVVIPTALQSRGLNTLTLLPHYWLAWSGENLNDPDIRPGVEIRKVRFEGPSAGFSAAPAAVLHGNVIRQNAGTATSFYLTIPDRAFLRGMVDVPSGNAGHEGSAVLAIRLDGQQERILGRWDSGELNSAGGIPVNVDLAAFARQSVALSLTVSSRSAEGSDETSTFGVDWKGLQIGGTQSSLQDARPRTPEKAPNVIMVLFDTLRADFTEPYGGREAKTPNMTRLAESGVTFLNASSNAASTRPSVATLLTGLVPTIHGVNILDTGLPATAPYLPSILQEAGYVTIGVSDNPHISKDWGFERGFDRFTELSHDADFQARRRTARAEALASHTWENFVTPALPKGGDRPFFLYLHEIDPHFPYDAPPPFDNPEDFGYRGALLAYPDGKPDHNDPSISDGQSENEILASFEQSIRLQGLLNRGRTKLDESDIRYIRSRYAAEVSYMDVYLGWIMDHLAKQGLDQNTLVVFVSDHGEEFLEHGFWTHGPAVYEEAIRVPLILSMPGVLPARLRSSARAELLDVLPTILDLAGIARPPIVQGRSLLNRVRENGELPDTDTSFAFADVRLLYDNDGKTVSATRQQQSILVGPWKLLRDTRSAGRESIPQFSLFNLADDSSETVNRWASKPILGNVLRQTLTLASSMNAATKLEVSTPAVDEAARDRLRALGYLQ